MAVDYSKSDLDAFAGLQEFPDDTSGSRPVQPRRADQPGSTVQYSSSDLEQFAALADPDVPRRIRGRERSEPTTGWNLPRPRRMAAPAPPAAAPAPRTALAGAYSESDLKLFDQIVAKGLRSRAWERPAGPAEPPAGAAAPTARYTEQDLEAFDRLVEVSPEALAVAEAQLRGASAAARPADAIDEARVLATMKIVESDAGPRARSAGFALGGGRMKVVFSDGGR